MAVAVVVKVSATSQTGQQIDEKTPLFYRIFGTLALTGAYVAGGFILDLTQLFTLASAGPGQILPGFELPAYIRIWSSKYAATRYVYEYCPNAVPTLANGAVVISTAGAEIAAAALPAGVTGDIINFEVAFPTP